MELREAKPRVSFKEEASSEDEALLATLSSVSEIAFRVEENTQTEDEFSDTTFHPNRDNAFKGKKGKRKPKGKFKGSKFKCDKCEHSTSVWADLQKHQRKHSETKPFCCPIQDCNFSTRYPGGVKHHMRKHSQNRPFPCDVCKTAFKTRCSLETHMLRHNDEKPIQCPLCPFRCKRNTELRSHHIHAHTTEKKFQCAVCGLKTKFKADLTKHLQRHMAEEDRRKVSCEVCGKECRNQVSLRSHIRYMHLHDYQPRQCNYCGKMFKRDEHLDRHIKIVHQDMKNITCEICGARFATNNNKVKHMVTHDADRLNCCPLCPYKGLAEFDLRAHIGSQHSDYYLVNYCRCCQKKFKKKSQITQHVTKDLHLQNSKTSVWKNQDLYEYRLEPKSTYTKKSRHVTCVLTEIPSFEVETKAGSIPFPVAIKQEPVDTSIIKTEPGIEDEMPIKTEIVPCKIRNIHADSAPVPKKRGRPRKNPTVDTPAQSETVSVVKKRGRPRKNNSLNVSSIEKPKKRGRPPKRSLDTNEPSQAPKRQKRAEQTIDVPIKTTWTVNSHPADLQIKTEKEDNDVDSIEREGSMLNQGPENIEGVTRTNEHQNPDALVPVPISLVKKKRGRPKGSKNNLTKTTQKEAANMRMKKANALKLKLKIAAMTTKKAMKQKLRNKSDSVHKSQNKSSDLLIKRKPGRPKGSKTKAQSTAGLAMSRTSHSNFEIEYDLTEDANVYGRVIEQESGMREENNELSANGMMPSEDLYKTNMVSDRENETSKETSTETPTHINIPIVQHHVRDLQSHKTTTTNFITESPGVNDATESKDASGENMKTADQSFTSLRDLALFYK